MTQPIHIFAAGPTAVLYAAFASECIVKHCPPESVSQLDIRVSCAGMDATLHEQARRFLQKFPAVSVIENPIKIPSSHVRAWGNKYRATLQRSAQATRDILVRLGVKPSSIIKLVPTFRPRLGEYYQEWIVALCERFQNEKSLFILDADFFVNDQRFFEMFSKPLEDNVFADGWVERWMDKITLPNGAAFVPVGSECFKISIPEFNRLNRQTDIFTSSTRKDLINRIPGISFHREMVDTVYQASWEAQVMGQVIHYGFRDLSCCHVGGFSHTNVDYILDAIHSNHIDSAIFWIQRMRLNLRVATFLTEHYAESVLYVYLEEIVERTKVAWELPEILEIATGIQNSPDEDVFEAIATSFASDHLDSTLV